MTVNLNSVRFHRVDDGLAGRIAESPRLLVFADEKRLAPLAAAHTAAVKAGFNAARLPVPSTDVADTIHADLLAGRDVDPAAIMEAIGESATAAAHRDRTVALIGTVESRLKREIVGVLLDAEVTAWDELPEQLDEILDRADAAFSALGTVRTADEAVENDRVTEWRTAKAIAKEYADLRSSHLDLLRANDPSNFGGRSDFVLHAFFAGIADVAPDVLTFGQRVAPPSTPHNVNDFDHFAWVVDNREALRPRVGTVDEAATSNSAAFAEHGTPGGKPEGGALRGYYGSEQAVANRTRNFG